MRSAAAGLLLAAVCCAQTRYLEIELAPGITPENVFIRYRARTTLLAGREFNLEARYVSRTFDPQLNTTVLVSEVGSVSSDGHFKLQIPDFSRDSPGEIHSDSRRAATTKAPASVRDV